MTTISTGVEFEMQQCVSCGVRFFLDKGFLDTLQRRHRDIFCPNGHSFFFGIKEQRERRFSEQPSLEQARAERDRLKKRLSVAQAENERLGERMHRLMREQAAQPATAPAPADHAECLAEQDRLETEVDHLTNLVGSVKEEAAGLAGEKQAAEAKLAEAVAASDEARATLEGMRGEVAEMHAQVQALVKERDTHLLRAIQWEYSAELHLAKIAEMKKRNAALKEVRFEVVAEPPEIPKADPPVHPMLAMCNCGHSQRRHADNADMCGASECACTGFVLTSAPTT